MNRFTKVLMTGSLLWYFGDGMLGPLFAVFTEKIGGNVLEIAWAWAIYLFVTGISMVLVGKLSDNKIRKEVLLIIGYSLNAVFTFAYLLVSTPWHLFVLQAGLGIAWALAGPTWDALYAKHEDRKHDGSAWGFADGLPKIVTALSIIIGGFIVSNFSFNLLFIIMGIVQVIATIYQAKIFYIKNK